MNHREAWTAEITRKQMHASLAKKKSKFGNTKVELDGQVFDSKKEAGRWVELKLMQAAGQITDLRRQVAFPLKAWSLVHDDGEIVADFVADFQYLRNYVLIVEDTKSAATRKIPLYRLKRKLFEANYDRRINEL